MAAHTVPASAEESIRAAGLRVTESRRAVYDVLANRPHAGADDLFGDVVQKVPGTSLQSVYNALGDFVAAGMVRVIEPAGHRRLYELRVGDNHHHIVCEQCGAVADVDCAVGAAPCLTASNDHGFVVRAAEVTFWGVCSNCAPASV